MINKNTIVKTYKALENTIMTDFANDGCSIVQVMTNKPYKYFNKSTNLMDVDEYKLHRYAHIGAHIAITNIDSTDYNKDFTKRPSFTHFEDTKYYFLSSSVYYCNAIARKKHYKVEKTFNIREDTVKTWSRILSMLRKDDHMVLLYDKKNNSYINLPMEEIVNDYISNYLSKEKTSQLEDKYIYINQQGKRIYKFDLLQTDSAGQLRYKFKKCSLKEDWRKNRPDNYEIDLTRVGNILWRRHSVQRNFDPHRCCGYPVKANVYVKGEKRSKQDFIFDSPLELYNTYKNNILFSYKTFLRKLKENKAIGIIRTDSNGNRTLNIMTLDLKYKLDDKEQNISYTEVKNVARKYTKTQKVDIFNKNSSENYSENDIKKFNMPVCVDKYSNPIEKGQNVDNAEYIVTAEWTKEYKETVDIKNRDRKSINMRPVCFVYESDKLDLQLQKNRINKLITNDKYKNNIFSITYSGNKSYHILVYINEKDRDIVKNDFQYYWTEVAKNLFGKRNLKFLDKSCASIAKLSRKPGGNRTNDNTFQYCYYLNREVTGIDLKDIIKNKPKTIVKPIKTIKNQEYSSEKTLLDLKKIYNKTHNVNCGTIIDILDSGSAPTGLTIGIFGYLKTLNGDYYNVAKELYDIVHKQHKSCFPKKFDYYFK